MKIGFHSYKGGVGRTKVMIGAGALLAMRGYRVALLDFDLDASGLLTTFEDDEAEINDHELLHILDRADQTLALSSVRDKTDLVTRAFGNAPEGEGCLRYIPTISNPEMAQKIIFNQPMRFTVEALLTSLLENAGVDFLLVDLTPGYSPSSALILPQVDRAVVVTRLDLQNIAGLSRVYPYLVERELDPLLVANQIPQSNLAQERLGMLEAGTGAAADVCINYDPQCALENDLGSVADSSTSLHRGLQALVSALVPSD